MKAAIAVVVAVEGITDRVTVFDLDSSPVRKIPVDLYRVQADQFRYGANALVAADILRHLHVVIVGISVLHWLEAAVELGVVLIHEEVRAVPAHELCGGTTFRRVLAGDPFIPVVDIEELRIALKRFIQALLEVDAVTFGMIDLPPQPSPI